MGDFEKFNARMSYDPETGKVWTKSTIPRWAGRELGSNKDGYKDVNLDGKNFRLHRVAYLLMTGNWPETGLEIDHINGDRSDNRWCNLRIATKSQNMMNRLSVRPDSKTGLRGVKYDPTRNRYVATIKVNGKAKSLGRFLNPDDAYAAFKKAELEFRGDFASCHC